MEVVLDVSENSEEVGAFVTYVESQEGSGRHSLWMLATYITGETPFPEFTAVLMLDDVQVGYFDSNINKLVQSRHTANTIRNDIAQEGVYVLNNMYISMKRRLSIVKQRFNLTTGVHVQQRKAGCEMLDDGESAQMMFRDACDGVEADGLVYNMTEYSYSTGNPWQLQWDQMKLIYVKMRYSTFYLPVCIKKLKYFLERKKKVVLRRVRPRVRFIEKAVPGGAQVSCLATDFYPRYINLTLLRDGQPVAEQELTGGAVLPNMNGLYQVRKTLDITSKELRERHNYTCTASHLSLDNRLDISWQPKNSHKHSISMLLGVLVIIAILIFGGIVSGLFLCVRRVRRRTDSRTTLQQPASIDQENMQLNPLPLSDS
ncbi:hereditary hemochromatosis protein homolog [Osmerus eperlanus]|uniref:hereditary hemochromatosis protein homolog n=1 Tax=Osmerus eperlanus TaxID=29151 RepID=UPI002E0F976E